MIQMRTAHRATSGLVLLVLACATTLCTVALAQEAEPLVLFDLATLGAPHSFGTWLQDALAGEPFEVRWPDLDEAGSLDETAACVVTWSNPARSGEEARQMRGLLRCGGGVLYVVGARAAQLAAARSFWAALDVNVQPTAGGSGFPTWVEDTLTEGLAALGAVTPNCILPGRDGKPLITVGGQPVAMSFDWGEHGRAIIVDQALLSDPLSTQRPPAPMRDFLSRCVRWAIKPQAAPAEPEDEPEPVPEPTFEVEEAEPLGPPASNLALVDLDASEDNWPQIAPRVVQALEAADLQVTKAGAVRGEPLLTKDSLDGVGVLAIGSCRDFAPSEAIAISRFCATGGRLLLLAHTSPVARTRFRMIEFNEILTELELAVSLGRPRGQAKFASHPITRRLRDVDSAPPGIQIWSYLSDTLVEVFGRPAAVAMQSDNSRAVLMDGGLLLPAPREEQPAREFVRLLERSVKWLTGEL